MTLWFRWPARVYGLQWKAPLPMSGLCRFELLLPLQFNDGQSVPRALLAQTAADIQRRFGGVSC